MDFPADLLTGKVVELITFRLAAKLFALPVAVVQEVVRSEELTRLPAAPYYVPGVLNLRGRVTPVIRLRTLLGLAKTPGEPDRFIVVCRHQGLQVGLLINAVAAMRRVPGSEFDFNVTAQFGDKAEYLYALVRTDGGLVSLLSIDRLTRGVLKKEGEADD
ncbi:MAG: chemotaxis protein CheW [Desulfovibrio sp.]